MRTVTDHLRDHLLHTCAHDPNSLDALRETEWSVLFEKYMRNRLIMGALRYGRMRAERAPYDHIADIRHRALKYLSDGNQEHLVDIANLALLEYVRHCCHPKPVFHTLDDGEHTKEIKK